MTEAITTGCYLVACPDLNEREVVYGCERAYVEDWLGWTDIEYGEP